jgi:hypothetical protein
MQIVKVECLRLIIVAIVISLAGCAGLISRMPGYHIVDLTVARIETVSAHTLFSDDVAARWPSPRKVIRLDLRSNRDLVEYFHDWILQLRCNLDGVANGKSYSSIGYGRLLDENERQKMPGANRTSSLSSIGKDGFSYTLYAFLDLAALDDDNLRSTGSFSYVPLQGLEFERITCYLIGVTKAPVLFPKSNVFSITHKEFEELLHASRSAQVTPNLSLNRTPLGGAYAPSFGSPVSLVR